MRVAAFSFNALLYEGSSALVYAGVRDSDGAAVVGKLLAQGRRTTRSFAHEQHVLEKVAGPGVVESLGVFEGTEGPVLVQRRFGTGSLAELVRHGQLAVPRALTIALQLARICARIHAARIVHRDLKPANILHDAETDEVALADFGLAAELPMTARALPAGDLVGTPSYGSPEHTGRTREGCDFRSDLYSLGVTLYELLTGVLPFANRDVLEIVSAQLSKLPEPPHRLVATIPEIVSDLVMKLLAKSPDERYQAARGLAADLERCLATLMPGGRIAAFELGGSDLLRPRFPQRLFGRGAEMQVLEQALARAATGTPTLVLLSGREGAGRTELVRALIREVAVESPLALGGWDAADDRPLSGLADALTWLAHNLLMMDEEYIAALRRQFGARVGQAGQVVLDSVPAMGDVFGPQPALADLPLVAGESAGRARLHHAFRNLAAALGDAAPFVLALRNFEHADPATVSLLEAMLSDATCCRVLIVAIASDPSAFGALRRRPDAVAIELGPLSVAALSECVAATLECDLAHAAELGEVLHGKTAGNPLVFARLLEHLIEVGVIDRRDGRYLWSLAAVSAAPPPPTLGVLAAQRIAELDVGTRDALAAVACSHGATDRTALVAMLEIDADLVELRMAALEREGLIASGDGGYRVAHPVIAETALAAVPPAEIAGMQGRLGLYLLAVIGASPSGDAALRLAIVLRSGAASVCYLDRLRVADIFARAGEHAMTSISYDAAAAWFAAAALMLDVTHDAWTTHRALKFQVDIGYARALMMAGRVADADAALQAIARLDLSAVEIGVTYASWSDAHSIVLDRARALEVGLEGLARLGIAIPPVPSKLRPFAAIRLNQRALGRLTVQDHLDRPDAQDPRAVAAIKILSGLTAPAVFLQRMGLYVLLAETALGLILKYGHVRNNQGFLALHACFLHGMLGDYAAARKIYEVAEAVGRARPAPELVARSAVVFHYMVSPWFGAWQDSAAKLVGAIQLGVEVGDPVFAALCASAMVTMLNLIGTPLDRMVAAVHSWGPFLRGDRGAAANAANVINLGGKLSRGDVVTKDDLQRVSDVPRSAGPIRNNAMVNLGLALAVCGHEAQVRAWYDEIRPSFPEVNYSQPHRMTLNFLDAVFAAKDARIGPPEHRAQRRADAEAMLEWFRRLRQETGATNCDPAMAVIEAQLARVDGDLDRAAGLFGRGAQQARERDFTPIVAYAHEERAQMLEEAGCTDEATLYYREALLAYRRWTHLTKVQQLEQAYPELRARDGARSEDALRPSRGANASGTVTSTIAVVTATPPVAGQTVNDHLDLVTVLKVSQDISTQLTGSGIVRAVLTGIAQNAGAERVVFVWRVASGVEMVYGEVQDGVYRDVDEPLEHYAALPKSVARVVRRTGRPLVVADAASDVAYAADPFVVSNRSRSIAGVPVRRKGEVIGFVVLENRMVAGAFTPQLVSLTQALVTQAAISLDNASLYKDLEDRVTERTAALHARSAEMRMVLDHVAQGLVIVGPDGRLFAERSAVLGTWFPEGVPDTLAGFFAEDPALAAWFGIAWDQLLEGFMPTATAIRQLPSELRRADRILAFDWQPIYGGATRASDSGASMLPDGARIERVLVVLSDVTEAVRRVEAEAEQKQLMAIFENLSEDRHGVIEFLREATAVIGELSTGATTIEAEKRLIHTLKGNAALFGLSALAARCHAIEDALAVDERVMSDAERTGLRDAWKALHHKLARFIDVGEGSLQVRKAEYESVLGALRRDGHPIAHEVELWGLESLRARFQRIGDQARVLAERIGKAPIHVHIEHSGVYIHGDTWAPFWAAFVHVVRNAIDHGLEDPEERIRLGKGIGALALRGYLRGGALVIELSDDGRGIAWDKLRDKATAAGLPTQTRKDLVAALFHDGISTRAEVSETSGRGVGLGALAEVCRAMGCEIAVDSVPGQGTTLRFEVAGATAKVRRDRQASRELVAFPPS